MTLRINRSGDNSSLTVLGDASLGRAGLAGVRASGSGRGRSTGDANTDVVVNPKASAILASGRVPFEAMFRVSDCCI